MSNSFSIRFLQSKLVLVFLPLLWGTVLPAPVAAAAETAPAVIKVPLPWPERTSWYHDMQTAARKLDLGRQATVLFTEADLLPETPELNVFTLPRPGTDAGDLTRVCRLMESPLRASFQRQGYVLLGLYDMGPAMAFSMHPVQSPADLKKCRIWAPSPRAVKALRALGFANPVQLAPEDVASALRGGKIDTVLVPPVAVIVARWHKTLKYALDLSLFRACGVLAASSDGLAQLGSSGCMALQDGLGKAYAEAAVDQIRKSAEALDLLRRPTSGLTFFTPGPQALKPWRDWAAALAEDAAAKGAVPRDLLRQLPLPAPAPLAGDTLTSETGTR